MRVGVDLGGTKIEAVVLDRGGTERVRRRVSTPRGDYNAIIEAVANLVETVEEIARDQHALSGPATVGVGIPGTISPATGWVKNANTTELNGHALDVDLAARLGRPVRVANDANCFALSEALDGAVKASGLEAAQCSVFGVILGTGTGGGLVVNGRLLTGQNHIAGEWGHNPLPWMTAEEFPGERCWCGKFGCIETWLSGPALGRDHRRVTGAELTAAQIAEEADSGNRACQLSLNRYASRLARALASVVNVFDPQAIVLGGGLSNVDMLYEQVPQLWQAYAFSDSVSTRLLRAVHGDSSGVRGAAWLWEG
jgi:fructokinase